MDRNTTRMRIIKKHRVALRKESVDRNARAYPSSQTKPQSLSARRAWIEIQQEQHANEGDKVALRKESVDRNFEL